MDPSDYKNVRLPVQSQSGVFALLQSVTTKIIIIALNAATGILSARALRPSGRGELAAIILWNVLFANAFTFGIPSALTYQLRKRNDCRSDLVGASLIISVVTSLIAILVAGFGIPHWIPQYSNTVIFFGRLFLFNVPVFAVSLVGRAALESEGDFTTSNLSLLLTPLLTLCMLGILYFSHRIDPVNAAWAYVAGGLLPCFIVLKRVTSSFRPSCNTFRRSAGLLISYGVRSYGVDLCGTMSFYVDQVLVVHLLQSDTMGSYVVALSLSRILNAFHAAVVMVLFPNMISRPHDVIYILTGRAVRITTFVTSAAGIFIVLLGPQLLAFLYGSAYRSATGIVRILVLEVIFSGITQLLSQAFMALGRPGTVTLFQVSGLVLTIPLLIALVPRYGIYGAALAILFSTIIRLVTAVLSFQPLLHIRCPGFFMKLEDWLFLSVIVKKAFCRLYVQHTVRHTQSSRSRHTSKIKVEGDVIKKLIL